MEDYDYEVRGAERWKNTGLPSLGPPHRRTDEGSSLKARKQYPVPDITRLNAQAEDRTPEGTTVNNDAQNEAREGKPSDDFYQLPTFLEKSEKFDEHFCGTNSINLNHIANKSGTHLSLVCDDGVNKIAIWGTKDAIAQAKKDLEQLEEYTLRTIRHKKNQKDDDPRVITKVRAAPTKEGWQTIFALNEQAEKKHFFGKMPEHRTSGVMGFYNWPDEIKPQNVLGMNYETLDDIRMDHECYIDYDRNKKHFLVLGSKPVDVENAIDRIYGVYCEVAAKNRLPAKAHLIEPPSAKDLKSDVYLDQQHSLVNRQITIKLHVGNRGAQCYFVGQKPVGPQFVDWDKRYKSLLRANHTYLRRVIQQALYDIHYCRGHMRMKVNFGTLVLFAYQKPAGNTFPFLEFMEVLQKSTQAELLRYIGNEQVGEELTLMCRQRSNYFLPVHKINPSVQEHPERLYSATFDLKLREERHGSQQDIRLEVQFGHEESVDGKLRYSVVTWNWLVPPNRGYQYLNKNNIEGFYKRKGPLDIKCLDLVTGLSWQFEISKYLRLNEADGWLIFIDFTKFIKLDVTPAGRAVVGFTNLPGLDFKSVVLKTKSQWYLSHSEYIFEVTKYEYFNGNGKQFPDGVASNVKGIKPDIRWGAGLSCSSWIANLAHQIRLPVGRPGNWDPDVSKFFKPSGIGGIYDPFKDRTPPPRKEWENDGFAELLGRIKECVRWIADSKEHVAKREEMARRGVREEDMD